MRNIQLDGTRLLNTIKRYKEVTLTLSNMVKDILGMLRRYQLHSVASHIFWNINSNGNNEWLCFLIHQKYA